MNAFIKAVKLSCLLYPKSVAFRYLGYKHIFTRDVLCRLSSSISSRSDKFTYDQIHDISDDLTKDTKHRTLADLNEEEKKQLHQIKLEYDIDTRVSLQRPNKVTDEMWMALLQCTTKMAREKKWKFYWKTEKKKEGKKDKEKRIDPRIGPRIIPMNEDNLDDGEKRIAYNRILFLPGTSHIDELVEDHNMYVAMRFGQPFIMDLSSERLMKSEKAVLSSFMQVRHAYAINRKSKDAFNMIICNASDNSKIVNSLHPRYPIYKEQKVVRTTYISTTRQSYLDLFPRRRLIYLSPYSDNVLSGLQYDDVPIVGVYTGPKPLCLARAKETGIRHARLPIHRYNWDGTYNLSLAVLMDLLLTFRETGNWDVVFHSHPMRSKVEERINKIHKEFL